MLMAAFTTAVPWGDFGSSSLPVGEQEVGCIVWRSKGGPFSLPPHPPFQILLSSMLLGSYTMLYTAVTSACVCQDTTSLQELNAIGRNDGKSFFYSWTFSLTLNDRHTVWTRVVWFINNDSFELILFNELIKSGTGTHNYSPVIVVDHMSHLWSYESLSS